MNRSRSVPRSAAVVVCLVVSSSNLLAGEFDGRLPIWPSIELDLDRKLPEAVSFFVEHNGRDFSVFWDAVLDSPRLVAPTTDHPFLSTGSGAGITSDVETELRRAAREFIDRNAPFFGVTSRDLGGSAARRFGGRWVLVLRQKVGDVFVRGS